jgi:hypothetical protein
VTIHLPYDSSLVSPFYQWIRLSLGNLLKATQDAVPKELLSVAYSGLVHSNQDYHGITIWDRYLYYLVQVPLKSY